LVSHTGAHNRNGPQRLDLADFLGLFHLIFGAEAPAFMPGRKRRSCVVAFRIILT
jgi:hypothetical protein